MRGEKVIQEISNSQVRNAVFKKGKTEVGWVSNGSKPILATHLLHVQAVLREAKNLPVQTQLLETVTSSRVFQRILRSTQEEAGPDTEQVTDASSSAMQQRRSRTWAQHQPSRWPCPQNSDQALVFSLDPLLNCDLPPNSQTPSVWVSGQDHHISVHLQFSSVSSVPAN